MKDKNYISCSQDMQKEALIKKFIEPYSDNEMEIWLSNMRAYIEITEIIKEAKNEM